MAKFDRLLFQFVDHPLGQREVIGQNQAARRQVIQNRGREGVQKRNMEFGIRGDACTPHFRGACTPHFRGAGIRHQKFTRRGNEQHFQFHHGALAGRVKTADGVDFIAEKVEARRERLGHHPQVENAAAPRKLSRLGDGIRRLVAHRRPLMKQSVWLNLLAERQAFAGAQEIAARQGARHDRARRGDDDGRRGGFFGKGQVVGGEGRQRLQPLAAGVGAPGGVFIKKRIRFGEQVARNGGQPDGQFVIQRQGVVGAVGQQKDGAG